jgi:hypothetical protein
MPSNATQFFKRAQGVPPASVVDVAVTSPDGGYASKAKFISAEDVLTWDPRTDPNPIPPLQAQSRYFVSIRLAFLVAQTVDVTIEIRSGGATHSSPFTWRFNGTPGAVVLCGVFIETA